MSIQLQPQSAVPVRMPSINDIIAFENGEMTDDRVIDFFQEMIDSGIVWQLQGHYGRTAANLIAAGLCTDPREA